MNTHDEVTYRTCLGDKETFHAAFFLAGKVHEYAQVSQAVSHAFVYNKQVRTCWRSVGPAPTWMLGPWRMQAALSPACESSRAWRTTASTATSAHWSGCTGMCEFAVPDDLDGTVW